MSQVINEIQYHSLRSKARSLKMVLTISSYCSVRNFGNLLVPRLNSRFNSSSNFVLLSTKFICGITRFSILLCSFLQSGSSCIICLNWQPPNTRGLCYHHLSQHDQTIDLESTGSKDLEYLVRRSCKTNNTRILGLQSWIACTSGWSGWIWSEWINPLYLLGLSVVSNPTAMRLLLLV